MVRNVIGISSLALICAIGTPAWAGKEQRPASGALRAPAYVAPVIPVAAPAYTAPEQPVYYAPQQTPSPLGAPAATNFSAPASASSYLDATPPPVPDPIPIAPVYRPAQYPVAPAPVPDYEQVAEVPRRPRPGEALPENQPAGDDPRSRQGVPPPADLPRTYQDMQRYMDNRAADMVPVPDRWRILEGLGIKGTWLDPYNNNVLKGDKPVFGKDWFVQLNVISDTVVEPRAFPVPVGVATTKSSANNDPFGDPDQIVFNQNLITNFTLIKGDTAFKPPDIEVRITPVFNYNYASVEEFGLLRRDPSKGDTRSDNHIGLQELFVDYHLRNVSDRYDFDSIRVGIQPFTADFRGFLFQDNQLGIRLFGTRNNNIFQYNLAWFRRLEKDTNSGLNDVGEEMRDDDVFFANVFYQDFPVLGFVSQASVAYNRNRETDTFYDSNGFQNRPALIGMQRPREYDVGYFGYNGDGHIGRLNLTASAYYAFGNEDSSIFINDESDIRAFFMAAEPSIDYSWVRLRASLLYASGDKDPFDDKSEGYSAIFENPQFAGADTSFWIRQNIPLIGGGGVTLSPRNGVLPDLRSSKEHGQSNFVNPGLTLLGVGTDFDVLPELRISTNFNKLDFNEMASIEALRGQGGMDTSIGYDLSTSLIFRPLMTQNIVFRLSYAGLVADDGFKSLYNTQGDYFYTLLGNLTLAY